MRAVRSHRAPRFGGVRGAPQTNSRVILEDNFSYQNSIVVSELVTLNLKLVKKIKNGHPETIILLVLAGWPYQAVLI